MFGALHKILWSFLRRVGHSFGLQPKIWIFQELKMSWNLPQADQSQFLKPHVCVVTMITTENGQWFVNYINPYRHVLQMFAHHALLSATFEEDMMKVSIKSKTRYEILFQEAMTVTWKRRSNVITLWKVTTRHWTEMQFPILIATSNARKRFRNKDFVEFWIDFANQRYFFEFLIAFLSLVLNSRMLILRQTIDSLSGTAKSCTEWLANMTRVL